MSGSLRFMIAFRIRDDHQPVHRATNEAVAAYRRNRPGLYFAIPSDLAAVFLP